MLELLLSVSYALITNRKSNVTQLFVLIVTWGQYSLDRTIFRGSRLLTINGIRVLVIPVDAEEASVRIIAYVV